MNACEDRTAWALFQCCTHRGAQLLFGQMVLIAQALGGVEAFSVVCGSFVIRAEIRVHSLGSQGYEGSNVPPLSWSVTREWGRQQVWVGSKDWASLHPDLETSGTFVNAAEAVCLIALWPCF